MEIKQEVLLLKMFKSSELACLTFQSVALNVALKTRELDKRAGGRRLISD